MICHTCASERPEAIVQGGSYLLRCGACGEHMVATSFIAVSDTDGEFSAYYDPGYGQPPAPEARIARGSLRDILAAVRAETDRGTIVLLIAETQ